MILNDIRTKIVVTLLAGGLGWYVYQLQHQPWHQSVFSTPNFKARPVVSRVSSVRHNWKMKSPSSDIVVDDFSAIWETCLFLDENEPMAIVFSLASDDGSRFYLDGQLIIDNWPTKRVMEPVEAVVNVLPGPHGIRVEYVEHSGSAAIDFKIDHSYQIQRGDLWFLFYPEWSQYGELVCAP